MAKEKWMENLVDEGQHLRNQYNEVQQINLVTQNKGKEAENSNQKLKRSP